MNHQTTPVFEQNMTQKTQNSTSYLGKYKGFLCFQLVSLFSVVPTNKFGKFDNFLGMASGILE